MAFQAPSTVAGWVAIAPQCGLPASNNVPPALQSICNSIAQKHVPAGFSNPTGWVQLCTAYLIVRGLIYYKNSPGDCGSPTKIDTTASEITGDIGGAAIGIASMAGAVLPGIGVFVSAIQQIFANHVNAVATEQTTICRVAGVINQVFAYYDAQVRSGAISPSTAYAGMQTYLSQVQGQLGTIEKTCNAACVYSAVLAAHAEFCQTYYPAIAPIQITPHAPGAPPASLGTTPGGVIQVGTASQQGTTVAAAVASVQPSSTLLVLGAVAAALIVFALVKNG